MSPDRYRVRWYFSETLIIEMNKTRPNRSSTGEAIAAAPSTRAYACTHEHAHLAHLTRARAEK